MMRIFKKILLLIICFSLVVVSMALPSSAIYTGENAAVGLVYDFHIPEIIRDSTQTNTNHLYRIREQEDLNSVLFQNNDGTKTLYLFSENVKYIDDNGVIKDKSNTVYSSTDKKYAFENRENDIRTYFSKNIVDGVTVSYGDYKLTLSPVVSSKNVSTAQKINSLMVSDSIEAERVSYSNVYDDTSIIYTPLYSGVKEDIVLNRYTNVSSFNFNLKTNGLYLMSTSGGLCIKSLASKDPVAYIGEIVVYDSAGNVSKGTVSFSTVKAYHEYVLTISVSKSFLSSESTVYPVSIDPSITFNTSGSGSTKTIQDAPVYSGYPNASFGANGYNLVGYINSTYGVGRALYQFPVLNSNLLYKKLAAEEINYVALNVREASGKATPAATITAHRFNGGSWSENTATYTTPSSNNYTTTPLSTNAFNNGNGSWATYNITDAAKAWKNGSANYGILLKNANETNSGYYRNFLSTEYGSYKPYLTISYSEPFYTASYEQVMEYYSDVNNLQLRANCYGYALGVFYSEQTLHGNGYFHVPGEFIQKPYYVETMGTAASTLNDIRTCFYEACDYSNERAINLLCELIEEDMEAMGYEFEFLTTVPYGQNYIPPIAPRDKRLVAMVVDSFNNAFSSGYDYHFYIQGGINQDQEVIWTHKPGNTAPTDKAINDNIEEFGNYLTNTVLTNDNFSQYASSGPYHGSDICFFYITKPTVIDYGHSDGSYYNCPQTITDFVDKAGNCYEQALYLGTLPISNKAGRIDYVGDSDHFLFTAPADGVYTISFSNASTNKIAATLYTPYADLLGTASNGYNKQITCSLSQGETYWLVINAPDMQTYQYGWNYSITISNN